MAEGSPHHRPLSAMLQELGETPGERIAVDELLESFGGRALGALLFVFGLACILPLPPGSTTLLGAPLLLLAPQLVFNAGRPWLPRRVRERSFRRKDLVAGLEKAMPWLRRVEAVSRPRLQFLFGVWGRRLTGLVCTILALVLILPIPLGNMLPAAAVAALSFSLVQRDGVIALLGYAAAAASAGVLIVAAQLIARAAQHFASALAVA